MTQARARAFVALPGSALATATLPAQTVAGTNYFVKVALTADEYAFLRIYDRFGEVSLTSIQLGKSKADELEYFE